MAGNSREIHNPVSGHRMFFRVTGEDSAGELVRIESVHPPIDRFEPMHVHPLQESRAEVVAGSLSYIVDGERLRLAAGESLTIPAGVAHSFCNDSGAEATSIQEFRPALRIAEFFRTYFELAVAGELGEDGSPSLLRSASMAPSFSDEIRMSSPPWPVQRAAFALLGPVARLRGYSAP